MNNQTTEQLKRIEAKRTLGLPLTERETAVYTLFGKPTKKRLILYRAKRLSDREWVYGLPRCGSDGNIAAIETRDGQMHRIYIETLGEFTGLTDKNNINIFEGDLVKIDEKYIRCVAYSGEQTAFCAMRIIDAQQSEITGTLGDGYDNYKRQYEIIGNIYDNAEFAEVRL